MKQIAEGLGLRMMGQAETFLPRLTSHLDTLLMHLGFRVNRLLPKDGSEAVVSIPFSEISDPAAPGENQGVLYVRDTGGKTQLCIRFHTGAVQVIATEP